MKNLLCKKSYPGLPNDDIYQLFLKGRIYSVKNKFHDDENSTFYRVQGEDTRSSELFRQDEFEEYFDDIAKIRKDKLKKINES